MTEDGIEIPDETITEVVALIETPNLVSCPLQTVDSVYVQVGI